MSEFDAHSFCKDCGHHRRRMPFGGGSAFFDSEPCGHCGRSGAGHQHVAKTVRVGRWPWQRQWVDREGRLVDVPENEAPAGMWVW